MQERQGLAYQGKSSFDPGVGAGQFLNQIKQNDAQIARHAMATTLHFGCMTER